MVPDTVHSNPDPFMSCRPEPCYLTSWSSSLLFKEIKSKSTSPGNIVAMTTYGHTCPKWRGSVYVLAVTWFSCSFCNLWFFYYPLSLWLLVTILTDSFTLSNYSFFLPSNLCSQTSLGPSILRMACLQWDGDIVSLHVPLFFVWG